MAKDIRFALESAGNLGLPQTRTVMKLYEDGLARGWGNDDFIGLIRLSQEETQSRTTMRAM
jgi:3-hydroxyisobutyrate dehydrogenase-like beta-hydroxyacid dehydrogenase